MAAVWWTMLITARLLPGVLMLDGLGGRRMPWPGALMLAICGAVLAFPYSGFDGTAPGGLIIVGLMLKEISVGSALALGASGVFYSFRMAGQIMDGTRGAMRSQSALMLDQTRASGLSLLYVLLACVTFLELGGAQGLLRGVVSSFHQVPIDALPSSGILHLAAQWLIGIFKAAIETAVWLAWPLMGSMIFVDVVLGVLCRSAPQLPVYFIGLPLKSSIGLLMAALMLNRVAPVVSRLLGSVVGV